MPKKILFLTPTLPYPPYSGGVIKSNKIVDFLSKKYDITVACFLKDDDVKYATSFSEKYTLDNFIAVELNIKRTVKNLILSNLQLIPLNVYRNKSLQFKAEIDAIIANFDIVFCDHYVMFQYISKGYSGKIILHQHNCEYLIWKCFAEIEKNKLKKIALLNQAWWIKKYEQKICKKATIILAAPNDTKELIKIGAEKAKFYETYHLGEDQLLTLPALQFNNNNNTLLYIGTLSWEANIDGLIWFYETVWPILKHKFSDLKLNIIGKNPDQRLIAIAQKEENIILTGFIEDVEPYFQKSTVFITPLRFGSGIKVKVINALYRGIPCVTTPIGTEGLKAVDNEHIFCKNNPTDFAAAISQLLTDKNKWEQISVNARKLANQYYTWDAVLKTIETVIEL